MHSRVVEETGGSHGVRDTGLLLSIAERPKSAFGGTEFYKDVFAKAAVYLASLVQYHVFVDGNKRTALITAARFLHLNGYELTVTNKALEDFVVRVAVEKTEINEIAQWLKRGAKKGGR